MIFLLFIVTSADTVIFNSWFKIHTHRDSYLHYTFSCHTASLYSLDFFLCVQNVYSLEHSHNSAYFLLTCFLHNKCSSQPYCLLDVHTNIHEKRRKFFPPFSDSVVIYIYSHMNMRHNTNRTKRCEKLVCMLTIHSSLCCCMYIFSCATAKQKHYWEDNEMKLSYRLFPLICEFKRLYFAQQQKIIL